MLPTGNYGVFEMINDEYFICSERAALNLAYQEFTKEEKKLIKVIDVSGE